MQDISPPPTSPVAPVQLGPDENIQFHCHKGIACFNKCCENIDILLTPYDILRLKNHFGISSREFIDNYTADCELDSHGMPGLKLRTKENSTACINLTPEGCGVYPDRPAACRYYALGLLSMRKKDSPTDEESYFVVKEKHCFGHFEPKVQTIRDYRREQGVDQYDDLNREWRQIILKKRSSGPTVGKPSARSFELFFLASYDLDGFRAFVCSEGFSRVFALPVEELNTLLTNEVKLMQFGFRFLKQVLFGEVTIPLKAGAKELRAERYKQRLEERARQTAETLNKAQDDNYESLE